MHNQREYSRISSTYSIKHHHGDDSKMPRACPIRSGYNYRKCATNKHQQGSQYAKMCCKIKTIEGDIEMQEIASPYSNSIKNEKWDISDTAK